MKNRALKNRYNMGPLRQHPLILLNCWEGVSALQDCVYSLYGGVFTMRGQVLCYF